MTRFEELRQRHAQALQEASMFSAIVTGERRCLTADERKRFDEALHRADLARVEIDAMGPEERGAPSAPQKRPQPAAGTHAYGTDVGTGDFGRSDFAGLGDFCRSVALASVPGGGIDPRLATRAAGMNETLGSAGGFLVDTALSSTLIQKVFQSGIISSRVRRIPLTNPNSNGVKLPYVDETSRVTGSRLGGVQTYWADEAEELTASKPKIGRMEMTFKKLTGLCYATSELVEDAGALEAVLGEGFRREMVFELENAIFRGTGAGRPLGILDHAATVVVSAEGGQAVDTINDRNVVKMLARLHPASWPNAVWLANVATLPQLMGMAIPVKNVAGTENVGGTSTLLFDPNAQTLLGKPVQFIEQAGALGDKGDVMLVDLGEYLVIERAIQAALSIHVRFIYDELAFRWVWRIDGQPAWKTVLTPANGSDTVSPFVVLAAR